MNRQQLTRQMILGAFTVALALPGFGAAAAGHPDGDWDRRYATFKEGCEADQGVYTDTEDGNTWCQWDTGAQTVCDTDGNDCHYLPRKQQLGGRRPPLRVNAPLVADPVINDGGTLPPLASDPSLFVTDRPTESERQPSMTAPANAQDQDHPTNQQTKKGKKGKKGGKGRRR